MTRRLYGNVTALFRIPILIKPLSVRGPAEQILKAIPDPTTGLREDQMPR